MRNKVDVIFLVEHLDREGQALKSIANRLWEEHKLSSVFLSISFHSYMLLKYSAKVYVVPYALSQEDWPLSTLKKVQEEGAIVANLNWEQLLSNSNADYKRPKDKFVKSSVSHLAWSDSFRTFLESHGVDKANIRVCGNPTNQLLRESLVESGDYRDLLSSEFSLNKERRWLFLPMNYGWAFSSDKTIRRKIQKGYDPDIAWEYRNYSRSCFYEFIDFILEVSKSSEYEIIIRPHPSIPISVYKNALVRSAGELPQNVLITKDYSIKEWIAAADIIGSSWSTSVWDAFQIGKKAFLFTPQTRPDWLNVWWNDEVPNINSHLQIPDLDSDWVTEAKYDRNEIHEISCWLNDLYQQVPEGEYYDVSLNNGRFRGVGYIFRSFVREFLVKKLGAVFIGGGLYRDYFHHDGAGLG